MQLEFEMPVPRELVPARDPRQLARRTDPGTSHAAAATVSDFAGAQHEVIVGVLAKRKDATVHEIATFCRIDAHAVGKRMNELQRAGKIRCVMDKGSNGMVGGAPLTRLSPSGRQARVWELVK